MKSKKLKTYLKEVHSFVVKALEHQNYPFSFLVEKLLTKRNSARSPFFDVMFVLEKSNLLEDDFSSFLFGNEKKQAKLGALEIESYPVEQQLSQFDLTLIIVETENGLNATFQYSTDLFSKNTIENFSQSFVSLLNSAIINENETAVNLSIISPAEKEILLNKWSETLIDKSPVKPIHFLFEECAKKYAEEIALIDDNESLTYKELNLYADSVCTELLKQNIKTEDKVAVFLPRSRYSIISLLGILKSGAVYVPIDTNYPAARIKYLLEDSGVKCVISDKKNSKRINKRNEKFILIDELEVTNEKNEKNEIFPENAAYVIYTSGSTGKPKGVVISHASISRHICNIKNYFGIEAGDKILQFSSLNFDASLEQIFTTLISGAALVMRGEKILPPAEFLEFIAKNKLTEINIPPAYWNIVSKSLENYSRLNFNSLKLIIVGGDVMNNNSIEKWEKIGNSKTKILNAYGPTETTITSLSFEVLHFENSEKIVPIGKPRSNRRVYILDDKMQLLPIGMIGELYIGGSCNARGYLNRPELTAEKFVPNPYGADPGERMYKTGDLVRFLKDGNLEFINRRDNQIKLRGFRIELGEVEAEIQKYEAVKNSAVTVHKMNESEIILVAYYEAKKQLTSSELRSFLAKSLPDYMIPQLFIEVNKMPLTPEGKIIKSELPDPKKYFRESKNIKNRKLSPLEEQVSKIFSEVLRRNSLNANDNFFELGGHSLLAIQVLSRIKEQFNAEIPLQEFFVKPDIENITALVIQYQLKNTDEEELNKILNEIENLEGEKENMI